MFLIAGLGNPDKKYEKTRHNIGFDTVDALAEKYNIFVRKFLTLRAIKTIHISYVIIYCR